MKAEGFLDTVIFIKGIWDWLNMKPKQSIKVKSLVLSKIGNFNKKYQILQLEFFFLTK